MRGQKRIWHVAGMVGIAVMVCTLMGCDGGSGRLAMEDSDGISDVIEGPQASGDGPVPVVEEPAPAADGEDVISQRIDELFARLEAKADENKDLLETIAELERNVRDLRVALTVKAEGADCSPLPSRPTRPSLPPRPSDASTPSDQQLPPRPAASENDVTVSAGWGDAIASKPDRGAETDPSGTETIGGEGDANSSSSGG